MNEFGDLMYTRMIIVKNTVLYLRVAKRVDFKGTHHKKKKRDGHYVR